MHILIIRLFYPWILGITVSPLVAGECFALPWFKMCLAWYTHCAFRNKRIKKPIERNGQWNEWTNVGKNPKINSPSFRNRTWVYNRLLVPYDASLHTAGLVIGGNIAFKLQHFYWLDLCSQVTWWLTYSYQSYSLCYFVQIYLVGIDGMRDK